MIVRTYGRRNRGIGRTCSDSGNEDVLYPYSDSHSQETSQDLYGSLPFSSQESASHWGSFDFEPNSSQDDPLNGIGRKSKKPRIGKRESNKKGKPLGFRADVSVLRATSTLMETQEFGEMMEHVDEVNFALDGLRKGQPVRIRRASLLSLLSICATMQQRRLLRTQGMAKTIIDAILGLSFDDSISNLAAAALFYVLIGDGQDDHLLESPSCIRFLIKLLKPIISSAKEDKTPKIGSKLLALCKDTDSLRDSTKRLDSSSAAILSKVKEILVSCKEIKSRDDDCGTERPELTPKWIALLTIEKACLSKISLEDTSGTVRKSGGNFKEKLRELGGLDAVFVVAKNCHSIMEKCTRSPSAGDSKDDMDPQSLVLLLKCLKIMENATFLSNDNQSHLLGMKSSLDSQGSLRSFTELIISLIKILSGCYLLKSSSTSSDDKSYDHCDGTGQASKYALLKDCKVDMDETICVSSSKSSSKNASGKSFRASQDSLWLSTAQFGNSMLSSETTTASMSDTCSFKTGVNSSTFGSCSRTLKSSNGGTLLNGSGKNLALVKRPNFIEDAEFDFLEDTQDPYAFDEDDFEPSKWDLLSGKPNVPQTRKSGVIYIEIEDDILPLTNNRGSSNGGIDQQELSNGDDHHSPNMFCSIADKEKSSCLADCLLTAVKVLMNLTNDNPVGCRQIARCGGLESLSSLIAGHFPSFTASSIFSSERKENGSHIELDRQNDIHLTDQELDFLVAILGLLVNLVEKDGHNRSRLAAASVVLPGSEGSEEESRWDVIPLLCSIFLANQGAGEAAEEGKVDALNDEAAMLQGEREAEKMIVEAYSALLLAFLSTESKSIRDDITACLPKHNLAILVPVLERFVAFHLSLNMISPETHKVVSEVIESCRIP